MGQKEHHLLLIVCLPPQSQILGTVLKALHRASDLDASEVPELLPVPPGRSQKDNELRFRKTFGEEALIREGILLFLAAGFHMDDVDAFCKWR